METLDDAPSLTEVLADLTFPAEKWEVITCAQIRGTDLETRRRLHALPCRTYRGVEDIAATL